MAEPHEQRQVDVASARSPSGSGVIGEQSAVDADATRNAGRSAELDHLILKAQELVRNLDTLSMATEPELSAPATAGEPQTLAELDQEIASSLDEALQSHTNTVESVLDTVFEERAAIVQQINRPLPVIEEATPAPAPETPAMPVAAPQSTEQAPAPAEQSPTSIEQPPAIADVEAAQPGLQPANALDEASAMKSAPVATEPAAAPEPIQASASAAKQLRPATSLARIKIVASRVARPAVPLLVVVNYPLRLVPQSMRSALDWIALTLLIWAPIVWIMVVALGGSPDGSGDGSHEAATATNASTAHAAKSGSPEDHAHSGH